MRLEKIDRNEVTALYLGSSRRDNNNNNNSERRSVLLEIKEALADYGTLKNLSLIAEQTL
jgi:hypothetical protein